MEQKTQLHAYDKAGHAQEYVAPQLTTQYDTQNTHTIKLTITTGLLVICQLQYNNITGRQRTTEYNVQNELEWK